MSNHARLRKEYAEYYHRISARLNAKHLITAPARTLAYGTDASFYRLIPQIVIKTKTESEIQFVLEEARRSNLPLTFRAAGTSLSGQSISDSILVTLGSAWKKLQILDGGNRISLQPGVIGSYANACLASYGRKIGPDPASINAAMIGGIAANNASGMCCGTAQNSYHTVESMRIVFQDGTLLDTADSSQRMEFLSSHRPMVEEILRLSRAVKENRQLEERIRRKYSMKNTTGYSLNALVDYADPVDIIQHLMIGSEGTLGFISDITYRTVPELPHKATSLMIFPSIEVASAAVVILKRCRVDAVEIMDRPALRSVENKTGMPEYLKIVPDTSAALLVDTRAASNEGLRDHIAEIRTALRDHATVIPIQFTTDPTEYAALWNIRKGLFPSVGAMRRSGTTCIIEDVAFPLTQLAEATIDLQALLRQYQYDDAIIFGHALEGNLHFVFNQDFNDAREVQRYAQFIDAVTRMVVHKYDGALKAEHGTGRNMAPFVELEWGMEAAAIMRNIKEVFDPSSILNPGVLINNDPQAHLKNLKPLPQANDLIDKCIECGFCEVHCPSRNLTLTPRQRIVLYREIHRLDRTGEDPIAAENLEVDFQYDGNETCATDGLCATACPVNINTGALIKQLRFEKHSRAAHWIASMIAGHMSATTAAVRFGLNIVDRLHRILGSEMMTELSTIVRGMSGGLIPQWNRWMPRGADPIHGRDQKPAADAEIVVYFPSCINRSMGPARFDPESDSLTTRTQRLLTKAGFSLRIPGNCSKLCCGMAFDSKGFKSQGKMKADELNEALLSASEAGRHPVLVDMSPCLFRMRETLDKRIRLFDPSEFVLEYLVDRLDFKKLNRTVTLHSTCTAIKMNLPEKYRKVAELCAAVVVIPDDIECCGWAGDRGFTYPELNDSALERLPYHIPKNCHDGYSTSRTCEIGLSLHSGISYRSLLYLVDECTTAKTSQEQSNMTIGKIS